MAETLGGYTVGQWVGVQARGQDGRILAIHRAIIVALHEDSAILGDEAILVTESGWGHAVALDQLTPDAPALPEGARLPTWEEVRGDLPTWDEVCLDDRDSDD